MHKNITVAVATRHRTNHMENFLRTLRENTPEDRFPFVNVVHDAPLVPLMRPNRGVEPADEKEISKCEELLRANAIGGYNNMMLPHKGSMAELWNLCVVFAPTDWVLICNDDVFFQSDWLNFLEEKIESGKYVEIDMACYAGFCISKELILEIGYFDERFRGGAHEDHDWQVRLGEAGYKNNVDVSRQWNDVYLKHESASEFKWKYENNGSWMCEKWGRRTQWHYGPANPSYRRYKEIDWYPSFTKKLEAQFGREAEFLKLEPSDREIYLP